MSDPNNDEKYLLLAEKWIKGTITAQEEAEFSAWYNANQDKTIMLPAEFAENEAILKQRMLENIRNRKDNYTQETIVRSFSLRRIAAAAILVLFAGGAWYFFNTKPDGLVKQNTNAKLLKNELPPGGDKAVLTLADGSKIVLDSAQNGALTHQGGTKLVIVDAGRIAYNQNNIKKNGEVLYNTISTPKGGQYQVLLSDGTKVWLNAATSLRFPTAFSGAKRNVELVGEAYFEVAKNEAVPFNVQVNDMNAEVLGTHFNIMGYNDEASVKTTLLEGVVKVTKGTTGSLLKPGKQASFDKNAGSIKVTDADVEEAVAWKNGLFQFTNRDIRIIMRQIGRWYDADISFEGNTENRDFTGQFARNSGIEQVLKKLELTGGVHFKVDGRKIIVML